MPKISIKKFSFLGPDGGERVQPIPVRVKYIQISLVLHSDLPRIIERVLAILRNRPIRFYNQESCFLSGNSREDSFKVVEIYFLREKESSLTSGEKLSNKDACACYRYCFSTDTAYFAFIQFFIGRTFRQFQIFRLRMNGLFSELRTELKKEDFIKIDRYRSCFSSCCFFSH